MISYNGMIEHFFDITYCTIVTVTYYLVVTDKQELNIPSVIRQRRPDSTPTCYLVSSLNESKAKQMCRRSPIGVIKYPFLYKHNLIYCLQYFLQYWFWCWTGTLNTCISNGMIQNYKKCEYIYCKTVGFILTCYDLVLLVLNNLKTKIYPHYTSLHFNWVNTKLNKTVYIWEQSTARLFPIVLP